MKKFLAIAMAAIMVLSFAACGDSKDTETTTSPIDTTEVDVTAAIDATEDENLVNISGSDNHSEETAVTEEETTVVEIDISTPEGAIEFYKAAAAKSDDRATFRGTETMALESLDAGDGALGKFVSLFVPIAQKALEKNSGTFKGVTGGYENLTVADVTSATAVDDGKYTTVTIKLKDMTVGMSAPEDAGTVGHGITTLGEVQSAIDELKGVEIDTSNGSIKLTYSNAQINVKVDNATGKIVSGTWGFKVNISIVNVRASIGILGVTLEKGKGVVDYKITY